MSARGFSERSFLILMAKLLEATLFFSEQDAELEARNCYGYFIAIKKKKVP